MSEETPTDDNTKHIEKEVDNLTEYFSNKKIKFSLAADVMQTLCFSMYLSCKSPPEELKKEMDAFVRQYTDQFKKTY